MTLNANAPIGIFDSGVGGLTVARAVADALPHESLIYFGDTLHLPYGDKSEHVICDYVKNIADFLLLRQVKLILVACNTASVAAYEMLQTYIGSRALLINVIDPVVTFLSKNYSQYRLGLIGTKLTIDSAIYEKCLRQLNAEIELCTLATPLLVPIIEEGLVKHQSLDVALATYLADPKLKNISALVLGCTHYPLIKQKIDAFYQGRVDVIDTSQIIGQEVVKVLSANNLLASGSAAHHFYASDAHQNFLYKARAFFGADIIVEEANIFV